MIFREATKESSEKGENYGSKDSKKTIRDILESQEKMLILRGRREGAMI